MKRSEMTPEQLGRRAELVDTLRRSGWDPGGWEVLWEGEMSLTPEAQAEYRSPSMDLRASYEAEEDFIRLELRDREARFAANLRFYADDLGPLLRLICAFQDSLTPDTFADLVREAIPLSRLALFEDAGGVLIKMSL